MAVEGVPCCDRVWGCDTNPLREGPWVRWWVVVEKDTKEIDVVPEFAVRKHPMSMLMEWCCLEIPMSSGNGEEAVGVSCCAVVGVGKLLSEKRCVGRRFSNLVATLTMWPGS